MRKHISVGQQLKVYIEIYQGKVEAFEKQEKCEERLRGQVEERGRELRERGREVERMAASVPIMLNQKK